MRLDTTSSLQFHSANSRHVLAYRSKSVVTMTYFIIFLLHTVSFLVISPGVILPISLLERHANKNTREKGCNFEPRNARVHAFRGNFSSGYPCDKGLYLT